MKFWGKIKTEDRIQRDLVQDDTDFPAALVSLCGRFDIGKPIICEKHAAEMHAFGRTVFYPDDFIEQIDFDTLEIEIINTRKNK